MFRECRWVSCDITSTWSLRVVTCSESKMNFSSVKWTSTPEEPIIEEIKMFRNFINIHDSNEGLKNFQCGKLVTNSLKNVIWVLKFLICLISVFFILSTDKVILGKETWLNVYENKYFQDIVWKNHVRFKHFSKRRRWLAVWSLRDKNNMCVIYRELIDLI